MIDTIEVGQAARALGLTPSSIRGFVRKGELRAYVRGPGPGRHQMLIDRDSLLAYVRRRIAATCARLASAPGVLLREDEARPWLQRRAAPIPHEEARP